MLQTTYRKLGIKLTHVWFSSESESYNLVTSSTNKNTDIFFVHGTKFVDLPNTLIISNQISLIKHLKGTEEDIWQTFGKHLRSYIKRSQKEATRIEIYNAQEINQEVLCLCKELYEQMKKAKGIPGKFNMKLAREYIKSDALVVSVAFLDSKPVGYNAYIVDDKHFRAWLTAFAFRESGEDAQAISRVHQQLEWETMRYCLSKKIAQYDFGGICSFEEPNGIDKFKISFAKEGQKVEYDNFLAAASLKGRILLAGLKLFKKFIFV